MSQRVCIKQPSLAPSLMPDSESELAMAGEKMAVRLRTQLPFVTSHLTISARYMFTCVLARQHVAFLTLAVLQ